MTYLYLYIGRNKLCPYKKPQAVRPEAAPAVYYLIPTFYSAISRTPNPQPLIPDGRTHRFAPTKDRRARFALKSFIPHFALCTYGSNVC